MWHCRLRNGKIMVIDIRTLILVLGITHIIQFIVLLHQHLLNKTFRGIGWCLLWSAAEMVAFAFMLLRGLPMLQAPLIIVQNTMLLAGVIFLYMGMIRFFDKKENIALILAIFAIFVSSISYFLFVDDKIEIRSVVVSAAVAIVSFLSARALMLNKTSAVSASATFLVITFIAHGCYHVIRIVVLLAGTPINNFFDATLLNVTTCMVAIIAGNALAFGFIIMINQRLHSVATQATEELALIFNTTPDAITITRLKDAVIKNINQGFTALSWFTREEVIGKTMFDINVWENSADRQKFTKLLNEKGTFSNFEAVFKRKDGEEPAGLAHAQGV